MTFAQRRNRFNDAFLRRIPVVKSDACLYLLAVTAARRQPILDKGVTFIVYVVFRLHYLAWLGYPVTAVRLAQATEMRLLHAVITLKGFRLILLISRVNCTCIEIKNRC
jgi:hypothetical protein